jgi:hypothetical protein
MRSDRTSIPIRSKFERRWIGVERPRLSSSQADTASELDFDALRRLAETENAQGSANTVYVSELRPCVFGSPAAHLCIFLAM